MATVEDIPEVVIETHEYRVEEVANYFIEKGVEEGKLVNPMKLQKLLYFSYGWYLTYFPNKKLFNETLQAWRYGPVIESIYHEVKSYGNYPITEPISKFLNGETNLFSFKYSTPRIKFKNDDDKDFLEAIWNTYSQFSALKLSAMTHAENTPWKNIAETNKNSIPKGTIISDGLILKYFESYRNKNKQE